MSIQIEVINGDFEPALKDVVTIIESMAGVIELVMRNDDKEVFFNCLKEELKSSDESVKKILAQLEQTK
tara:strand:- start:8598 stop:8804 length:207 start_codon:yes stop_codon:yes gene_type:complete